MNYQVRDKFFFVAKKWDWPYPSREAIGISLDDNNGRAEWRQNDVYRFRIKDVVYEMDRAKAEVLGRKFYLAVGKMPHMLPKEEFKATRIEDYEKKITFTTEKIGKQEQIMLKI